MVDLLGEGCEIAITFLEPAGRRFSVRQLLGRLRGTYWVRLPAHWGEQGPGQAAVAAGAILEVALPLADLDLRGATDLAFFVAVNDATGAEVEREPAQRAIRVAIPDERFESRQWTA
jgi:hypothetical protein